MPDAGVFAGGSDMRSRRRGGFRPHDLVVVLAVPSLGTTLEERLWVAGCAAGRVPPACWRCLRQQREGHGADDGGLQIADLRVLHDVGRRRVRGRGFTPKVTELDDKDKRVNALQGQARDSAYRAVVSHRPGWRLHHRWACAGDGNPKRLLKEKPTVAGIAVGGMPTGSPGMEVAGVPPPRTYNVVTFDKQGAVLVASYSTPEIPKMARFDDARDGAFEPQSFFFALDSRPLLVVSVSFLIYQKQNDHPKHDSRSRSRRCRSPALAPVGVRPGARNG